MRVNFLLILLGARAEKIYIGTGRADICRKWEKMSEIWMISSLKFDNLISMPSSPSFLFLLGNACVDLTLWQKLKGAAPAGLIHAL